ncbi:hypothetical protein [Nostoc sp. TCL240-02]|uniref:hypothetical protein n=1 Tax=Nostoc sp. TCL240-02 TaxID=2572090 RepID=UPI00157FA7A1|nr:hypothetical protein [Nostoc sp. TCL240-02]
MKSKLINALDAQSKPFQWEAYGVIAKLSQKFGLAIANPDITKNWMATQDY